MRTIIGIPYRQETKILGIRLEREVLETVRLSWIALAQRTQNLARETFLRTLYLRQIHAYLRSLEALEHGTECDTNWTNGNVVVPVTSEGISRSSFYASKSGARGWKRSHSYCCEKFNNVSSAMVAPIRRYVVTYGQLACGLNGVYGDAKPAQLAGYSLQHWINMYKNFFMNGVATYIQKQMNLHVQWSFGFIALWGGDDTRSASTYTDANYTDQSVSWLVQGVE